MGFTFGKTARALGALVAVLPFASAVPFGLQIYSCTLPGVIAPGFDDGPWIYSEDILNRMEAAGIKATWFINGANKGNIYDYNSTLLRMVDMGHQIGSHTWSHKNLATLTADGVKEEMLLLEEALVNILGYFPYYMRPPFLSVNAVALQALKELQYHVIIGDLNTKDWQYQSESGIETAKKLFTDGLDLGRTIIEAHEQEEWTHGVLIDFMIQTIQARGLKTVTVAECLQDTQPTYVDEASNINTGTGMPSRTVSATALATPLARGSISPDRTCGDVGKGNNNGYICKPGQCCSKYGNCGTASDYCAPSVCQSAFGIC
ncbi:carbohydrate-binding module family 18 protein, partial [Bipolaris victoriae FI3]